jgi:hypothetical protein
VYPAITILTCPPTLNFFRISSVNGVDRFSSMREEALLLPYEAPVINEDHPLFNDLCEASRRGDLERVS